MGRYALSRLLNGLWSLAAVLVAGFLVIRLIPGDPIVQMLGINAKPETVAIVKADLGLDRPLWSQFVSFVGRAATGDFGTSIVKKVSVGSIIGGRLLTSVELVLFSVLLALLVAVPVGLVAAIRKNRLPDSAIRFGSMVALAMPSFWLGLMLILVFGLRLEWLPVGGVRDGIGGTVQSLFLPAVTIACYLAPQLIRALRSALIESMQSGYVEATRARGFSELPVVGRSAMKNSMTSVVSILAINIGFLLSGTVVVEAVFQIPGMGSLLVQAVLTRDFPIIQGLIVVFGVLVVAINVAADIVNASLDPRVLSGAGR